MGGARSPAWPSSIPRPLRAIVSSGSLIVSAWPVLYLSPKRGGPCPGAHYSPHHHCVDTARRRLQAGLITLPTDMPGGSGAEEKLRQVSWSDLATDHHVGPQSAPASHGGLDTGPGHGLQVTAGVAGPFSAALHRPHPESGPTPSAPCPP